MGVMRSTLAILFLLCSSWTYGSDQDVQNTREAIDLMQSHLAAAELSGAIALQQVRERRLELIEARILLAELEHKPEAVTPLLKEIVELWSVAELRQAELIQANAGSMSSFVEVQRASLGSQVRLAQHTGDREALRKLSKKWVELENQQLERVQHLVKEGLISPTDLARQKLRVARAGRVAEL
jgi:hypothetical protein